MRLDHPVPEGWESRLRQISPIVDRTSHLRFRWSEKHEQWALYECMPAALVTPDRAEQLAVRWQDLPKAQQPGRRQFVSEYQAEMWRLHRLEARTFWVLQGSKFIVGGTPAYYTDRERGILERQNLSCDVIPFGTLPNIPFDERVVDAIVARDRLIKVGGDLDALEKQNRPEAQRAADEETEKAYRKTFLAWHSGQNAASAAFMQWFGRQKEAQTALPPAPKHLANDLSDWKDRYIETGMAGTGLPASRKIQIAVR